MALQGDAAVGSPSSAAAPAPAAARFKSIPTPGGVVPEPAAAAAAVGSPSSERAPLSVEKQWQLQQMQQRIAAKQRLTQQRIEEDQRVAASQRIAGSAAALSKVFADEPR